MYIKREDFENKLREIEQITMMANIECGDEPSIEGISIPMRTIRIMLKKCPSADVIEHKRGEWKSTESWGECNVYECSVCGEPWELNYGTPEENNMNFCPNCGADMRGNSDE